MSHSVYRLLKSISNTPQLITVDGFTTVASILEQRNLAGSLQSTGEWEQEKETEVQYNPDTGIGVISVFGPLTNRPVMTMCGEGSSPSYMSMQEQMAMLAKLGAHSVIFEFDTPGGEAFSCFEGANVVRQIADEHNIKLIGYVDGMAASAGYAWAAVMDELIANPDSEVGSVGVVIRLTDYSKALEQEGIKPIFVTAGANKVPFAEDGSFKSTFLEELQDKVDVLYENFVTHVATHRNISPQSVKDTEAGMFMIEDAIRLGLVDRALTRLDFASYMADIAEERKDMSITKLFGIDSNPKKKTPNKDTPEMTVETSALAEQLASLSASLDSKTAELSVLLEKFSALEANYNAVVAEKAAMEQERAAAAQAAALAKVNARKASLASVVGDSEVEATYADMADLSDEAFGRLLSKMSVGMASQDAVNPMFTETGVEASADTSEQEDPTARMLREKYQSK